MNELIGYVEYGNRKILAESGVKITLYVFENLYSIDENDDKVQKRKSFPLDYKLNEAYPETLKLLIQYIRLRMLTNESEIKIGLVVTRISESR